MVRYTAVRCLGRFAVDPSGIVPESKYAAALIAKLAVDGNRPIERATIADMLWDGPDPKKKRHSLSQVLYSLRRDAPGAVECTQSHILLHNDTWRDTVAFVAAYFEGRYRDARSLYAGPFLDGFPYLTDAFDDWRIERAAYFEELAVEACAEDVKLRAAAEDHAGAAEAAKNALLLRPYDERFARARVEALAFLGDSAKALRELDSYRKRILAETGTFPSLLADDLVESIAHIPINVVPIVPSGISSKLYGRSSELARIRAHLSAPPYSPRVVLIQGEPGIGKTRVWQDTLRRMAIEGARVYSYTCAEVESRLPHSTVVGLIRDGLKHQDLDLLENRWRSGLSALLPELFHHNEIPTHDTRFIWEATAQYFGMIARNRAVTLAIDDLQWIDDGSMDIITYILKRNAEARLYFVGAGRPPLRSPAYEDDRPSSQVITLKELSVAAVDDLVGDFERLNSRTISPAVRHSLQQRIGGRPFFLLQALVHLNQKGDEVDPDDILSPHVAGYITRRVGLLSNEARCVAHAMAVLNRSVPIHALAAAAQLSSLAVSHAIDELVAHGILADHPTPWFSHDLVREAILGSLPEPVIAAWHARIAESFVGRVPDTHGIASYHFECAGNNEKAAVWACAAGEAALHTADYSIAADYFARAVRCSPPWVRGEVLSKYSVALAKLGNFAPLFAYLEELEAHTRNVKDEAIATLCLLANFTRQEQAGGVDTEVSVRMAKEILLRAETHLPDEIATVLWQVADSIRRSGELSVLAQFAHLLEKQSLAVTPAHKAEMLSAAALLGGISIGYEYATPLSDRAVEVSCDLPEGILTVRTLFARGTAMLWSGRLDQARQDYVRALAIAESCAIGQLLSSIKSNFSVVLMEQGEYASAEQLALESLREAGAPRRSYSFGNLATIKLRSGDWAGVRHYAKALGDSHCTTPHSWIPAHVEALMGLADLGEADVESAQVRSQSLTSLARWTDPLVDTSHAHLLVARTDHLRGESTLAITRLEEAASSMLPLDVISATRLQLELARVLTDIGERDKAWHLAGVLRERTCDGDMRALQGEVQQLLQRCSP